MTLERGESLLCVVHFPANTGFAWNYFEGLYAGLASALGRDGVRTYVSYPVIGQPPRLLQGTLAEPILLDATLDSWSSIRSTIRAVRRLNVRTVYFTDRGWWHWAFPVLRLAGVKRIVAHDHTSGARTVPQGLKRIAKWVKARLPGMSADLVIAVSEYVATRQREVGLVPSKRVVRLWYGIELPELGGVDTVPPIPELSSGRPLVVCVCRAAPEKGVDHLLRAFDLMMDGWPASRPRPLLVYVGNGPQLDALQALRDSLRTRDDIVLTGYRSDAYRFVACATVSVVPSVWQDACPLGVLEPMAYAKPVIASAVGGVPDEIDSPEVGELVPPADIAALADAIRRMLLDANRRTAIGQAARERITKHFDRSRQMEALVAMVRG